MPRPAARGGAAAGSAAGRKKSSGAPRVRARERKEEAAEATPHEIIIVPEDQLKLTPKELDEEITRVVTGADPHVPTNPVIFNFVEKEYKAVAGGTDEHTAYHLTLSSSVMHVASEDASEQTSYEKNYRAMVDERRREKLRAAQQEEGKDAAAMAVAAAAAAAAGQEELDDDLQRNQFNFSERAAQSHSAPLCTRSISTTPPEKTSASGLMTQWKLFDAYTAEYDRLVAAANAEKMGRAAAAAAARGGAGLDTPAARLARLKEDPMSTGLVARALKLTERQVSQNAEDEIYADFKYWEDASDTFNEACGTCLPLWKFEDPRVRRKQVTGLAFNPGYPDLFAVGYGSYEYMRQGSGIIAVYTLKNVGHPEFFLSVDSGVMCLDFHPTFHSLLVVGCYDGTVKIYDIRRRENRPVFSSDTKTGKHADPVWEVKWTVPAPAAPAAPGSTPADASVELTFCSISSDGKIINWVVTKSELKQETVIPLKSTGLAAAAAAGGAAGGAAGAGEGISSEGGAPVPPMSPGGTPGGGEGAPDAPLSSSAAGCCFAFNPFEEGMYLVGTEEGRIHRASIDAPGQYAATYEGHHLAVYSVRWNEFHPRVFLSASADWTVKVWDYTHTAAPIASFDVGTALGDAAWAPYSSATFAAVTDEGKVYVYDLHANKHEPLCEQKVTRKAKCTHLAFSRRGPVLLVGDSQGAVMSLKLSPNLRRVTPIPEPPQKKGEAPVPRMSREEVEIRKMDRILALSDAKITIVTPIPGQAKAGAKAEGGDAPAPAADAAAAEGAAE